MAVVVEVTHPNDGVEYNPLKFKCRTKIEARSLIKVLVLSSAKGLHFPVTSPNGMVTVSKVYDVVI